MAKHYTAKIPFTRVVKMGIICNQNKRATLQTIYNELVARYPGKEVYVSNCGFFAMCTNWTACFGLKAAGTVWASNWNMPYIGIKNDKEIEFCKSGTSVAPYTDAVSAYPVLLENGKKSSSFSHCIDNSNRGRTMLGFNGSQVVLSVIADTAGSSDFTLDEELSYMQKQGCTYAINLDGGGSSQCNFNGSKITSTRKVHNLFYIIANKATTTTSTSSSSSTSTATVKASDLKVGQVIKLTSNAKYTTNYTVPNWVKNSVLYVRSVTSTTVTFSTQKTGAITGTVLLKYVAGIVADATSSTTSNSTSTSTSTSTSSNASSSNSSTRTFTVGQTIKLKTGAKYTSGTTIPTWVINSTLYVRSITNYGIVFSTQKTGAITGIVNAEYIV